MIEIAGRRVLVVGGGDSAVECAVGLANQAGTDVTMAVLVSAENANAVEAEPPKGGARCAARAGGGRGVCRKPAGERGQAPRKRGRPKTGGERGEDGGQAPGRGRSRCSTFKGMSNTYHDAGNVRCYHK